MSAQADALQRWDNAAQLLGSKFETFFSHVFSIYGRGDTKIIAGIRRTINEVGGPEAFLRNVVGPLAKAYDTVLRAADVNISLDPDARRYLVYLGRLPEGDWAPAAMLAVQQHADDPERATLLLREIDRLVHLLRAAVPRQRQARAPARQRRRADQVRSADPARRGRLCNIAR